MTICNMTIFSEIAKYDYLQYEYFFEKMVIFHLKIMTNKNLWKTLTFTMLFRLYISHVINLHIHRGFARGEGTFSCTFAKFMKSLIWVKN